MPRSRRHSSQHSAFSATRLLLAVLLLYGICLALFTVIDLPAFWLSLSLLLCIPGIFWFWRRWRKRQRAILTQQQAAYEQYQRLLFAQNIGNLLSLTPREFELTIGDLLCAYGYQHVRHTGGAGDLAADLAAFSPQGEYVVIQCKRYAPGQRIGSADIQKFLGMVNVHHRAQRGIFITTSTFTEPARLLAQQHNIDLIDGQHLTTMFAQVQRSIGLSGQNQIQGSW